MAPADETILITGASGFVGSGVVLRVLKDGYKVVLTVRNADQIPWLKQVFGHEDKVKPVVVEDFLKPGAFDEVVKGVDYVIHTASPIPKPELLHPWKENYIDPAVKPTIELLTAATKEPKIKKVVITSSCISFVPMDRSLLGESRTASEASGNPKIDESFADTEFGFPFGAYHGSKIAGDVATWKFHDEKKPHYAIVTIHPDFVYGPIPVLKSLKSLDDHHTTSAITWREYNGIDGLLRYQDVDHSVHIDDVADAHVKVLDDKIKDGEQYLLSAGEFKWDDLLEYAKKNYPEMGFKLNEIPDWKNGWSAMYFRLDGSKAEKELGIKYKDIYKQFDDMVAAMKKLGA
ncbi:Dihydroflavonol-4-reductase [Dactylellina cionopaga]|nr:Dihydroflavonol-4-reductase [Dactylellina cionopaga]